MTKKKNEMNETVSRPTVMVTETMHGYQVNLSFRNPDTGKLVGKKFALRFGKLQKKRLGLDQSMITGVLQTIISKIPLEEIKDGYSKKGMTSMVQNFIRNLSRRKGFTESKDVYKNEGETVGGGNAQPPPLPIPKKQEKMKNKEDGGCSGDGDGESVATITTTTKQQNQKSLEILKAQTLDILNKIAIDQPPISCFSPEMTGVTFQLVGKSCTGKTTFIMQQLNLLTDKELAQYNAIIFFTESPHARPLKLIEERILKKLILMDRFCPMILRSLKKVNDGTGNAFKFLVIYDDILELRGELLTKSILTLRNSNISTMVSVQYDKIMSPSQRSSVHNIYIFNLLTESWEYLLKGYLLGNFKEVLPSLKDVNRIAMISQVLRECMGGYISYYNQRKDTLTIYKKQEIHEKDPTGNQGEVEGGGGGEDPIIPHRSKRRRKM